MPEKNEKEDTELSLGDPKEPPDGGGIIPPNQPEVETGGPRGGEELE